MTPIRQLLRDRDGGALVEFVLVLPVMILMLVGVVEFVSAYDAQRKAYHAAYAVADIVSQASTQQPLTNAGLADVITAGQALMSPLPTSPTLLTLKVASFTASANGKTVSNDWTYPSTAKIAAPTLQPGQSVILAEADYAYAPFSAYVWAPGTTLTFSKQAMLQPRYLSQVPKPTG